MDEMAVDSYLRLLDGTLLNDLLDDLLLVRGTKLGIEDLVGCTVQGTLLSVPADVSCCSICKAF